MKMRPYLRTVCILLVLLALPLFSHAQIAGVSDAQQFLTVTTVPEFPRPNDRVTVSLESFSFDLNTSTIIWSLSGKVIGQGIGDKTVSLNAGSLGKPLTVSVDIAPIRGSALHKDIVIAPATVDFLWQAKTYTPPFYKGKALFSGQAPITLTAVPQVSQGSGLVAPETLVYYWTLNGDNLSDQGGYGKKSIIVAGSFWGSDDTVKVKVSTPGGDTLAQNSVTLSPGAPHILIYENNPLLGILFEHAITNTFTINQKNEVSFFAAPFYFISNLLPNGKTTYQWTMNGQPANGAENGNTITFRQDSGQTGTSNIALTVNQAKTNFQNASVGFSIQTK